MKRKRSGMVWELLAPFLIYYVIHYAALYVLVSLYSKVISDSGSRMSEYLQMHAQVTTVFVRGMPMIIGVLPLIPMLRKELAFHKEITPGAICAEEDGEKANKTGIKAIEILLTVILAVSSSVGFNILMTLTGFLQTSSVYQEVANRQYGVAFGVGMILYVLISPIVEEIVFRGLVFNRMRNYCPATAAILLSGILFGAYHGNMVQGVYGGCLGILIAYLYFRMKSFFIPCLFHAAANLTVYMLTQNEAIYAKIFVIPNYIIIIILSAAFAAGIAAVERLRTGF